MDSPCITAVPKREAGEAGQRAAKQLSCESKGGGERQWPEEFARQVVYGIVPYCCGRPQAAVQACTKRLACQVHKKSSNALLSWLFSHP